MSAVVGLGEFVRVYNRGDSPLEIGYDGRRYRLPVSNGVAKETVMPSDAAFLWFGDPRASTAMLTARDERGVLGMIPDRASEVRRLRAKYGGTIGDDLSFDGVEIPEVEVFNLQGDKIVTVLEDPRGRDVTPVIQTEGEREQLLSMLQRQQQQIEMLMREKGIETEGSEAVTEDELPRDSVGPLPEPKVAQVQRQHQPDLDVVVDVNAADSLPVDDGGVNVV